MKLADLTPEQRERVRLKARLWKEKNREKFNAYQRAYAKANRDKFRAKWRRWIDRNPEKVKAIIAAHCVRHLKNNPERHRVNHSHHVARKFRAVGTYTLRQWVDLCESLGWRCSYCGTGPLDGGAATRDHVIPLSRGGTNFIDNLTLACRSCNCSKKSKTGAEFRQARSTVAVISKTA